MSFSHSKLFLFASAEMSSPDIAAIPGWAAHFIACGFAVCYVGSLYISNRTRLSFAKNVQVKFDDTPREKLANERWRDDPDVILARLTAVVIATTLCCVGVSGLLWYLTGGAKVSSYVQPPVRGELTGPSHRSKSQI